MSDDLARLQGEADAHPEDGARRLTLGRALIAAGQVDVAIPELFRAKGDPRVAAEAGHALAQAYLRRGLVKLAVQELTAVRAVSEEGCERWKEATYLLGRIYEGAGETERALALYEAIAGGSSPTPDALFLLEPSPAPDVEPLAERVRWWRARERALRDADPELLTTPARERPAEAAGRLETFLPVAVLRDEVHAQLLRWFGPALERLGADLADGLLASARSVFDVRAWLPGGDDALPGDLLLRTATAAGAHGLLFALFASRRLGAGLGRYPKQLDALAAAVAPASRVGVWDAGCGTGEGTWELAYALADRAAQVEALGTTPWPLERLMAERQRRPHDPAADHALRAFVAAGPRDHVTVRFADHDLSREPAPATFDVVACHGVLGESLPDVEAALATLASAVAPGGLLSLTDRFREDVTARVRATAERTLAGWDRPAPGLFRRPAAAPPR